MRVSVLAGCAVTVLLAAGCASTGHTVTTAPQGAVTGVAKPSSASAARASTKPAGVGDTITISGFQGEKLTVTLVKVFPKTSGADDFTSPDSGKRYYAVQLRIKNAAASAYSDSPDNGAVLRDASGQQFQSDFANVTAGQSFGSVNLAPGDSVLGVIVFQVPNGDKPVKLQLTTDSGMGPGTAQWNLP